MNVLHSNGTCDGINVPATSSFTEALRSLSLQSKFYRHSSCFIFVSVGIKYTQYEKAERIKKTNF